MLWQFFAGALAFGFFFGGMLFIHAWRNSKDRLFLFFAAGFFMMAVGRAILGIFGHDWREVRDLELRTITYGIRFVAFSIIAFGIVEKNMRSDRLDSQKYKADDPAQTERRL
jgi:hypothetical protein